MFSLPPSPPFLSPLPSFGVVASVDVKMTILIEVRLSSSFLSVFATVAAIEIGLLHGDFVLGCMGYPPPPLPPLFSPPSFPILLLTFAHGSAGRLRRSTTPGVPRPRPCSPFFFVTPVPPRTASTRSGRPPVGSSAILFPSSLSFLFFFSFLVEDHTKPFSDP